MAEPQCTHMLPMRHSDGIGHSQSCAAGCSQPELFPASALCCKLKGHHIVHLFVNNLVYFNEFNVFFTHIWV